MDRSCDGITQVVKGLNRGRNGKRRGIFPEESFALESREDKARERERERERELKIWPGTCGERVECFRIVLLIAG